jgi:hypothetical protein
MYIFNTSSKAACAALFIVQLGFCSAVWAQGSSNDSELAKELLNPVADLITVPVESRFDVGPNNKLRTTINVQPVLPFELGPDLLVVSRTILPVIHAEAAGSNQSSRSGLGDITQSFFFARKQPVNGWILGAGPALKMPTASNQDLGDGVWAAGPTAVAMRQDDVWSIGMLASHLWSFAGRSGTKINATSLQPFLAYSTPSLMTYGLGSESLYDWETHQWLVTLDATISRLVRIGDAPVDFALGGRSYLDGPAGGPKWGIKFTVTFMLPK